MVGSGIMADRLSDDVARLAARQHAADRRDPRRADHDPRTDLGSAFQSGRHACLRAAPRDRRADAALAYVAAQIAGGIAGTLLAHAMFELPSCRSRTTVRTGAGQWIAEAVAAFGLVFTILAGLRFRADAIPWLVGLYITAAYWFTASTSFANPAVAIARALSDTFAGIRPADLPGFIAAELLGALIAMALAGWLLKEPKRDIEGRGMTVTIYHNPECGTSRGVAQAAHQHGLSARPSARVGTLTALRHRWSR